MNTTAPATNAERAAILHRRGLMRDKLRRRASVGHDGLTCPGHAVCDTATRRRPACAASSVRLPVVETPFAAADINSPPYIARTTLSLDGASLCQMPGMRPVVGGC